ncbi:MAG: hypothetical protein DHS20C18_23080 [Saprospiraceae bacterium]|nr:MAG: hypothetical protein DHS20C18_23080 [Saprospiraceae bacterium]
MNRNQLLDELIQKTEQIRNEASIFNTLTLAELNFKTSPESWSILECLEHLNLYGDYYLKEIEARIIKAEKAPQATPFKSGLIGNYFVNLIRPKEAGIKKIKALKEMNPMDSKLSTTTLDRFFKQQARLLSLLQSAGKVDLTKVKTGITFTKLIKLRLGDTLRFVVYHNERHLLQAKRVMERVMDQKLSKVEAS